MIYYLYFQISKSKSFHSKKLLIVTTTVLLNQNFIIKNFQMVISMRFWWKWNVVHHLSKLISRWTSLSVKKINSTCQIYGNLKIESVRKNLIVTKCSGKIPSKLDIKLKFTLTKTMITGNKIYIDFKSFSQDMLEFKVVDDWYSNTFI